MTHARSLSRVPLAAVALAALVLTSIGASAQDRGGNFLDNLFNRGEPQQGGGEVAPPPGAGMGGGIPADAGSASVRLDRLENTLRQLTGTIEQLQYQNQQLQTQLKRMQEDNEYRFQQLGVRGGSAPPSAAPTAPPSGAPSAAPGRRGDIFDPTQHPNAPGAPRLLGNQTASAGPIMNEPPVGAPGGRAAGAPLDLSTMTGNAASAPPDTSPAPATRSIEPRIATLPPTAKPQDEYDLAYGYVLHKDYALAERSFEEFLRKHPNERLAPDAQYWLGESLFQQQRYRDAAESFLAVSTKHERSGKAPDALLRLGQSLAAMNKKEAACATLAEVERKYPKASAGVKRSVAQEQKRVRC